MVNPRIYRAAFLPVFVAVVLLAFSFRSEPSSLTTDLAPAAFNAPSAFSRLTNLATHYPNRSPGSPGDDGVANQVAGILGPHGFGLTVHEIWSEAHTIDGTRRIETVTAEQAGASTGRIVVMSSRDALAAGAPANLKGASASCKAGRGSCASLSGTATMIELARVLAGRTLDRTVEFISTSSSTGLAGATQIAGTLGGPIDAVIVLGDVAGKGVTEPVVVPWSEGENIAPLLLRNTAAAAVRGQAVTPPGGADLESQFARLALPLTLSEQGPFNARGIPAVLLSRAGELMPGAHAPVSELALAGFGRAALQTISALDVGPTIPPPSAYLEYRNMSVPAWPIRLLVLALILPVLCAAIDGFARARRRGHRVGKWVVWVLATALPFALASLFVLALGATGLIDVTVPGPVGAGAAPVHLGAAVEIAAAVLVLALAMFPIRAVILRWVGVQGQPTEAGAAAAVLLVMCAISLAIWVMNPFAAALIVPALHLWMWIIEPDVRLRSPVSIALLLVGLVPMALVILYYASQFDLGPVGVLWSGVLLIAGGGLGVPALLEWSIVAGCAVSVAVIGARAARSAAPEPAPVTVRGPITYAGPGSLGGTKSALRR